MMKHFEFYVCSDFFVDAEFNVDVCIFTGDKDNCSPVARMTTRKCGKVQGFLMVLGPHDITD